MADEFQAVKDVATHPATGLSATGLIAWLANKVWRGHRHEVANMKNSITLLRESVEKKADQTDLQEIRTDIRAIRESVENLTLHLLDNRK